MKKTYGITLNKHRYIMETNKMKHIYSEDEIRLQRIEDAKKKEERWKALAEQAGGGEKGRAISDAFRKLYEMYNTEIVEWFAKLYDPSVGGYYATTSGHDTDTFGPDVEATSQALTFIESSGMIDEVGTLAEALPSEMPGQIVHFAKSIQNPNGYFYHPQWCFDEIHTNLARRGRDLGWGTGLLKRFGAKPTYNAPNGFLGDGIDADGNKVFDVEVKQESPEKKSDAAPAAPAPYPEYLENRETFLAYLSNIDINADSYTYGNQFNATYSQIKTRNDALLAMGAGYSLCDIFIDWLNEHIDKKTGYWGHEVNFAGTNGFFKIITIYNAWGYTYPEPEAVTNSILSCIMGDELATGNCCSIYNLWSAVCSIRANAKASGNEETAKKILDSINGVLKNRGAEAILNTHRKMLPYKKNDCSFSHAYHSGGGVQQSMYVGLNYIYGVIEGSVDATCICTTGLVRNMFAAFGFRKVPMFMKGDWMVYKNILETYGPAKKTRIQNPTLTFDSDAIPSTVIPEGDAELKIENGELVISADGCGKGVAIYPTARICKGDFFLFESDIRFEDIKDGSEFILGNSESHTGFAFPTFVNFIFKDGRLRVKNDMWEMGVDRTFDYSGETIRLRVEQHRVDMPRLDKQPKKCSAARVYINGELLGTIVNNDGRDPMYPSGYIIGTLGKYKIYALENSSAKIIMDNTRYSFSSK